MSVLLLMNRKVTIIVGNLQSESSWGYLPMAGDEEDTEKRLCAKIQTSVEDGLAIRRNDLRSLVSDLRHICLED